MAEFRMPSLGADMTEGTVTHWLVKPGDKVSRGDIVVEIETDKADMEVEIFDEGTVEQLLISEGEKVPVGTPLALIASVRETRVAPQAQATATPGSELSTRAASSPAHPRATPTARIRARDLGIDLGRVVGTGVEGAITRQDVERAAARMVAEPPALAAGKRLLVSPRARRLAADLKIDLATVEATGPDSSVTAADVERLAGSAGAGRPEVRAEPLAVAADRKPGRKAIATLMERSNREIPHYYLGLDIDMARALEWLRVENSRRPVSERILYSALLLKATALAAREVPELNGYFRDGAFEPSAIVNLSVAISLRNGGLVAPAIEDAGNLSLGEMMSRLRDLVARARAGRLRASEMSSGTITVTNLGELGVDLVYGVIYPPQVALVGYGKVVERPWAQAGLLGVRPIVTATVAADHRASDGHRGGRFLASIDKLLQDPEHL